MEKQTEFFLQDYTKTNFPDESFDIVWAIESVCHSLDKEAFLKESYRILKFGGKLVVADGFLERAPQDEKEKTMLRNFLKGMVLDNLTEPTVFGNSMCEFGFRNIKNFDKTEAILPTASRMARMSRWSWPFSIVTTWLGLTPRLLVDNNRAGIDQYYLSKNRIITYRIFVSEK